MWASFRKGFPKEFPGDEPLEEGWWGQVRRWGALGLIVVVLVVLIAIPQPINLMTETPGDEESQRFPDGPHDAKVLWFSLVFAPILAGAARFRNGFFVPAGIAGAMLVSQILGGMSWNRFLYHEGPFIVIFGLPGLLVMYMLGVSVQSFREAYKMVMAARARIGLGKRKR